ncbi:Metallo-dependent phosphatase-like protein [Lentinula aciculospora]|uniref:Vacuolar protein sorting-associated protein 29 n=1 Tax=Lentinula aciculospora TaxID=153920 RepID=A0A9W9AWP2_9AGAR|nr:Metallo-dependent phosphatase-like protein [Lentinula aciculospora]
MVLVLVLGDLHIPHRIHDLPHKFKKLLAPGKISQVLCTGNICDRETMEYLRSIVGGAEIQVVRGDYDELPGLPSSLTVTHSNNSLRIGLIHGHQSLPLGSLDALSAIARQMDVDFLISGATHAVQAVEYDGRFFLNPGTATGAWTGAWNGSKPGFAISSNEGVKSASLNGDPIPSFALMDIQGTVVVTYVYQFIDGDVKVEKVEWRKPDGYGVDERVGGMSLFSLFFRIVTIPIDAQHCITAKTSMTPGVGSVMPQSIPSPTPMSPQNSGW